MDSGDCGWIVADLGENSAGCVGVELLEMVFPLVVTRAGGGVLGSGNFPPADMLGSGGELQWLGSCRLELQHPLGQALRVKQLPRDTFALDDFDVWIARVLSVDPRDGLLEQRVHART